MRISVNTETMPDELRIPEVEVGNVYSNTRGYLLIVVSINPNGQAQLLMASPHGEIVGVNKYGTQYLRELKYCGKVVNFPETIEVDWDQP